MRLHEENAELQRQIDLQTIAVQNARHDAIRQAVSTLTDNNYVIGTGEYKTMRHGGDEYSVEITRMGNIVEYTRALLDAADATGKNDAELQSLITTLSTARNSLAANSDETADLSDEEKSLYNEVTAIIDAWRSLNQGLIDGANATKAAANAADDLAGAAAGVNVTLKSQVGIYKELKDQLDPLTAALQELNEKGGMTDKTMQALVDAYPDLADAITLTGKGWKISTDTLLGHITALKEQYQLVYNNAMTSAQSLVNAEALNKAGIDATTMSIQAQLRAMAQLYESQFIQRRVSDGDSYGDAYRSYNTGSSAEYQAARRALQAANSVTVAEQNLSTAGNLLSAIGRRSSSSSSASSFKAEKDAELERLKNVVSLRESELDFLEASGASEDERIAKMLEIQDALHEQAEYMRSIGAEQADINALSAKWWKTQKDILDTTEEVAEANRKAFEEYAKSEQDRLEKLRDEEVSVLQAKLDAMESARDAAQDERKEQEKLLAVEKARIALQNAQNERNVRQYNAQTGAWEWVANAQTVQKAQEAFTEAQNALTEFRNDQLYEAQKRAVEQQIAAVKSAYNAQIQAWKDAATAVRNGAGNVADILENGGVQINAAIQKLIEALNLELQMAQQQTPHPDVGWNYSTEGAFAEGQNAVNGDKYITDNTGRIYDLDGNWVGDYASGWFPSDYQDASGSGTSGGGSSGGGTSSTKSISDYSADYNAARSAYLNGTMSAADAAAAMEAANKGANALRGNGSVVTANEDIAKVRNGTLKYDSGGILRGLGGIKATRDDELILPPDLTRTVMRPALDGETAQALDRMRVIYGAKTVATPSVFGSHTTNNSGDTIGVLYQIGDICVDGESAKHCTLSDVSSWLVDQSGCLPLHYNN